MRYDPRNMVNDDEDSGSGIVNPYVSDQTAFMRWSTEVEEDRQTIDKEFIKRHKPELIDINKFLPLSNITNPRAIKLYHLRRQIIRMASDAELLELAEEAALANVADYNTTRGQMGFYQKALITQKQEFEDKTKKERNRSFLSNIFRGKMNEEDQQNLSEGGY